MEKENKNQKMITKSGTTPTCVTSSKLPKGQATQKPKLMKTKTQSFVQESHPNFRDLKRPSSTKNSVAPFTKKDRFLDRLSQREALKTMRQSISRKSDCSQENVSQPTQDAVAINITCVSRNKSIISSRYKKKERKIQSFDRDTCLYEDVRLGLGPRVKKQASINYHKPKE